MIKKKKGHQKLCIELNLERDGDFMGITRLGLGKIVLPLIKTSSNNKCFKNVGIRQKRSHGIY